MNTQFINKEEAGTLPLLPFGKKHPVRVLIEEMKPGQMLRVAQEDFNWKRKTPGSFCHRVSKATGAKFRILKERGKTGWVVERVE
jgi:hypothetical protein